MIFIASILNKVSMAINRRAMDNSKKYFPGSLEGGAIFLDY
jgi:hypothetical protein